MTNGHQDKQQTPANDAIPDNLVSKLQDCPVFDVNENDWLLGLSLSGPPVTDGPKRIVANVSYLCSNQIFAPTVESQVPIETPPSIEEFAFHFKNIDPGYKRSRCVVGHVLPGGSIYNPPIPNFENVISTFDQIAKMYGRAVKKRDNPKLKLAVVGLVEPDELRAQDTQDDVIFGPKLARLPFGKTGWPVTHPQRPPLWEALVGKAKLSKRVMHKGVG
ncbi:hypothetical protein CcaverHIS002_0408070 [Cutaneotrichosporon cavernicola]|nr:hypothetical protein CcaverHIS002_0408070 [Cutaneotrichosporon cavernicola]